MRKVLAVSRLVAAALALAWLRARCYAWLSAPASFTQQMIVRTRWLRRRRQLHSGRFWMRHLATEVVPIVMEEDVHLNVACPGLQP